MADAASLRIPDGDDAVLADVTPWLPKPRESTRQNDCSRKCPPEQVARLQRQIGPLSLRKLPTMFRSPLTRANTVISAPRVA
eukprot:3540718-Pyramimonas_sp.AAC.1